MEEVVACLLGKVVIESLPVWHFRNSHLCLSVEEQRSISFRASMGMGIAAKGCVGVESQDKRCRSTQRWNVYQHLQNMVN